MISTEYIASVVAVVTSILTALSIEIGHDLVNAVVTGAAAIYVIVRKIYKGEITVLGKRVVSEE